MPVALSLGKSTSKPYRYSHKRENSPGKQKRAAWTSDLPSWNILIKSRVVVRLGLLTVALLLVLTCGYLVLGVLWNNAAPRAGKFTPEHSSVDELTDEELLIRESSRTRLRNVADRCKGRGKIEGKSSEPIYLDVGPRTTLHQRIFLDHTHKIGYCSVPKAACTKWKQVIGKSSGVRFYEHDDLEEMFPHYDNAFRRASNMDTIKANTLLQQYYIFTVVRDPMVRLVSAWKDKFQPHSLDKRADYLGFHSSYGRTIMKQFRSPAPSEADIEKGFPIAFSEFVDYVISFSNPAEMNEHWQPMSTLCRPCHVPYKFLGKFETQRAESAYLVRTLGLQENVPEGFFREPGPERREEAIGLIGGLREDQKIGLVRLYQEDAKMFGYSLGEFLNGGVGLD